MANSKGNPLFAPKDGRQKLAIDPRMNQKMAMKQAQASTFAEFKEMNLTRNIVGKEAANLTQQQ